MSKYSKDVLLVSGNVLRMGVLATALNNFTEHPRVIKLLKDGGAHLTYQRTYGNLVRFNINNKILAPIKNAMLRSRGYSHAILNNDIALAHRTLRSIYNTDYYTYNYARFYKTENTVWLFRELITHAFTYLDYLLTVRTLLIIAMYLSEINVSAQQLELIRSLRDNDGCDLIANNVL